MKTIAELQNEIRGIKKDLGKLDGRLDFVDSELSSYKNRTSSNAEYSNIYNIAKSLPIIDHPILGESHVVRNNYLGLLLMIAGADDSINEEQLLFLQRLVLSNTYNKLEDYIANLGKINYRDIIYNIEETIKTKYKNNLLLDAIILANLSESNEHNAYNMIASVAAFWGLYKADIQKICQIAKAILVMDANFLPSGSEMYLKQYEYYLLELPEYQKSLHQRLVDVINYFHSNDDY